MHSKISTFGIHIWQTEEWGKMLKNSNQVEKIFEIGGVFIEKRKVSMGEYGLFILGLEKDLNDEIINKLIELCKKEKCLFVQFETLNYRLPSIHPYRRYETTGFNKGCYKKFITPYTAVIDLKNTEEYILKQMKPKGRYNIKLAVKKGVEVIEVEKTDENIKIYYDLMLETTSRDNFSGNSWSYYNIFLNTLKNSKLLFAYIDGKVIAGGIFIFGKEISIYYYGASISDRKYRNLMAPYLLQWESIKIAKNFGSKLYDFLGVASPNKVNSELSGVTNFKKKLSNDIREVSQSYIWVNKRIKYRFILFIRYMKRRFIS